MPEMTDTKTLEEFLDHLGSEIYTLCASWRTFELLFGGDGNEIPTLNRRTARFFGLLESALADEILMRVGRIFDAPSFGKSTNISLEAWVNSLPATVDEARVGSITKKLQFLKTDKTSPVKSILDTRNKLIAHRDRAVAIGDKKIGDTTMAMVADAVEETKAIFNDIRRALDCGASSFDAAEGDATDAVNSLMWVLRAGNVAIDNNRSADDIDD